jgi:hypothetical protein
MDAPSFRHNHRRYDAPAGQAAGCRHQPAPLGQFQGQPARLLVAVDLPDPVHQPRWAEFIANDRPILAFPTRARSSIRCWSTIRKRNSAAFWRAPIPRPVHPGGDRGQWLDDLAADPLLLHHRQFLGCRLPAPTAPFLADGQGNLLQAYPLKDEDPAAARQHELAGHRRSGPRRAARMIYGFRISVLFGLTLTILSA